MFRNYLLVTFRNLIKNRLFTVINIIGLGIALSVCVVAFFNNMFNHDFNRTHENFEVIYRVNSFRDMQGREQEYGIVPATLGLEIKNDIPGIDKSARLLRSTSPVKEGDDIFSNQISYVDPEFLDIFTFPIIYGSKQSIENQANVLISSKLAVTLFGEEFPVGKMISIVNDQNKEFTYTVGAVFEDLPENSSFRIDILTHFDNFLLMWNINDTDWKTWVNALFIQVTDKSAISSITTSLKSYLPVQNRAREDFRINRFVLIPLKDVGNNSREIWSSGLFPSLHPAAVLAPPIMALFILLIACFNFANTSRATFSKRLKEIGLRKTFGGQRRQLVTQFMTETFIICFLAMFVGVAFSAYLVPAFSSLWPEMTLHLSLIKYPGFWAFSVMLVLITGFIAGVYPALYVSSFSPVNVLKGTTKVAGSGKLSIILLTLQFSISIMALVMGIVFVKNANYQKSLDRGYDNASLIAIPISPEFYTSFRNEISRNPKIISAEGTQSHIGFGIYRRPIKDEEKQLEVDVLDVGPEYATIVGLRLVEGRLFDESRAAADRANGSILINQKWADDFGWSDPVGRTVTMYDTTRLTIIGVVEDYYNAGLWRKIEPVMLRLTRNEEYGVLVVRAKPEDLDATLEYIKEEWKSRFPNYLFQGMVQNDTMQEEVDVNSSITKINLFLAIIATLLSLVGMFNLVSLDIIKRTKEIGIRKIQGAPVATLMYLISRKFLIVLAVASVLGCAGGYYMSLMLLDSVWDYFVDIKAGVLVSAAAIMFMATTLTLLYRIIRAALRNPAVSLRYE